MDEKIDRKFIPSLREGIDVVKMIFFRKLRNHLIQKYPEKGETYAGLLAGAIMNELFGCPNPQEKFKIFADNNWQYIRQELYDVPKIFPDLCILLTDALRMDFLCNNQEGIGEKNEEILKNARDYGILIQSRDVPLPKGFMELVYRIGKANGLIVTQKI